MVVKIEKKKEASNSEKKTILLLSNMFASF
jgi:hypothetical protein